MTISKTKAKNILILFTVAAFCAAGFSGFFQNKTSASGFSGKIFTSLFDGQFVPVNKYSSKDAVYLNGGPVHEGANGLPDGTYYFQVTGPGGNDLLSTDLAECRQLIVANGVVAAAEGPACQHPTGVPQADGSSPIKLMPFDDTPNPGGNYKAWLIRQTEDTVVEADGIHIEFKNSDAKKEIFRVDSEPCPNCGAPVTLSGMKFYDANQNAVFDLGELPVEGINISIDHTINGDTTTNIVTTDASGNWSALARHIEEALALLPRDRPVPVLLTAHSLPRRVADQEPAYLAQLRATAELVAGAAGLTDDRWRFCWQSAGHEPGAWMTPDFADLMPELARAGHRNVMVAPIQFLADHLEILYDVDVGAREQAERAGMSFHRIASLNDDPGLVEALAAVAGRAGSVVAASAAGTRSPALGRC